MDSRDCFRYSEGEIHFNLMALVSDRQMVYQREIEKLQNAAEADSIASKTEMSRLRLLIEADMQKKKQYKVSAWEIFVQVELRKVVNFFSSLL